MLFTSRCSMKRIIQSARRICRNRNAVESTIATAVSSSRASASTLHIRRMQREQIFLCRRYLTTSESYPLPHNWNDYYRPIISQLFRNLSHDRELIERADALGIQSILWHRYINNLRRNIIKDPKGTLHSTERCEEFIRLLDDIHFANGNRDDAMSKCSIFLTECIFHQIEIDFAQLITEHRLLSSMTDMRLPHEWYPFTRLMKRKIIYHGGPTNSGKTYHALQRLGAADPEKGGGLYCGPLRLLALEVYEQLNIQGVHTNLLTGQEKKEVPGASHISCTLEMVNINRDYDVAVIDEIQMISDQQRGYAWTKALLGLRAREIHVCGGLEAKNIVQSLAETAGDEFVLKEYNRLSTLKISSESLKGDYSKVEPGDCIVAFSKADIFSIRKQIEQATPYRCAIIYGQLPSETRSTQARLFNDEDSGYDILVASDAIGMGLNLNIRRIVFHTTLKRDRESGAYWVDPSSVKQIAGRAGRLSSKYSVGEVTTWQEVDLAYVKAVMEWEIPQIKAAGIFPSVEQIEIFSKQLEATKQIHESSNDTHRDSDEDLNELDTSTVSSSLESELDSKTMKRESFQRLSEIMVQFVRLSRIDQRFFMCDHEHTIIVSNWLHTIPLSLTDRFVFSNAPVNMGSMVSMNMLYHFAAWYALGRPVALNVRLRKQLPKDLIAFTDLCTKHNILELYLWLSLRFPKHFIEQEQCLEQKNFAINQIEKTLDTAAKMKHDNKHATSYYSLRRLLQNHSDDNLPPIEYGESIRMTTKYFLDQILTEDLIIISDEMKNNSERHPKDQRKYQRKIQQ